MNDRTDWLAWTLQFILGMFVGAMMNLYFITGSFKSLPLIIPQASLIFILGSALIGGAVGSYYGDELWLSLSCSILPANRPRHTVASIRASRIAGCVGGIFVLIAIGRSFDFLP